MFVLRPLLINLLSEKRKMTFPRNKKMLKLCFKDYNFRCFSGRRFLKLLKQSHKNGYETAGFTHYNPVIKSGRLG